MTFFGLFVNGEPIHIIRWDRDGVPTMFDFDVPIASWIEYEVREVEVTWR